MLNYFDLIKSDMKPLFSIAPMMDYTDRHYRYLMRLITRRAWLYTEMLHSHAILQGDTERLLAFAPEEHPLVLQLGGSEPHALAKAAKIASVHGYDEVNLNIGCPSQAVQAGRFGACLMAEPQWVADCVKAMRDCVEIPITVKTRIGIDHADGYPFLCQFIETVTAAGCDTYIIHARKAWLKGLSPKENRTVPPLDYDRVYQLKQDYPDLSIIINGGINTLSEAKEHLNKVDGVMVGRQAYHDLFKFIDIDRIIFNDPRQSLSRKEILIQYFNYCRQQHANGVPLRCMLKHLFGLMHGTSGAKAWRRHLTEMMQSDKPHLDHCLEYIPR